MKGRPMIIDDYMWNKVNEYRLEERPSFHYSLPTIRIISETYFLVLKINFKMYLPIGLLKYYLISYYDHNIPYIDIKLEVYFSGQRRSRIYENIQLFKEIKLQIPKPWIYKT